MVRLKQIVNDVEVQAFTSVVPKKGPLSEEDWNELDALLPSITNGIGMFQGSQVILGQIPKGKDFSKEYKGTGKTGKPYHFWKLAIFIPPEKAGEKDRYVTFTVNEEAARTEYQGHLGAKVAVIGKLTKEPATEKYDKESWVINFVRDWEILYGDKSPEPEADPFEAALQSAPPDEPPTQ